MDIDAFSAARRGRWERLQELTKSRRRTGAEADEMAQLYQSVSSDLSTIRSTAPEPSTVARLSVLIANARVWLGGAHVFSWRDVARFFAYTLPAALYRVRWMSVAVCLAYVGIGLIAGIYTFHSPEALDSVATPEQRAQIAEEEFANYYVEYDSTSFAAQVYTNNWQIAARSIVLGASGIFPLLILYQEGVRIGVTAAIMAEQDALDIFFQLIIPHGLLELTAVLVAIATGLRLFWRILVPGAQTRARAFASEGLNSIIVMVGLAIALGISGAIEGYVTGADIPWWSKIVVGVVAFGGFWYYMFRSGRVAVHSGQAGAHATEFTNAEDPVAA